MDKESENIKNVSYYKYSESGILKRNKKLWNDINKIPIKNISFKEKFYLYENNIELPPICYCGNSLKFINMNIGYRKFCSRRCMLDSDEVKNKRKSTCIYKYGVDNPSKNENIKNSVKETNKSKFGHDYPLQSPSILDNIRKKFIEKYGVDNPSKIPEVRIKASKTMVERYGVEHALNNNQLKDKMIKTLMYRYGGYYVKTDEYKNKIKNTLFFKNSIYVNTDRYELIGLNTNEYIIDCNICKNSFTIQRQLWRNRIRNGEEVCLICNPIKSGSSIGENELLDYITKIYSGVILKNHRIIKEIDIYLPELKIGIEYNGLYWHSELNKEKNYHFDKYNFFREQDIDLISIWEDDWKYKKDIIKSILSNRILKKNQTIFARKCKIVLIHNNKICKDFLIKNHLQGYIGSSIKIGLTYNNELVSLMTFGKLRKSLGRTHIEGNYELLRFCTKLNTNIIGGAKKIISHFKKLYNPKLIISYSKNGNFSGGVYEKMGFKLESKFGPSYFWVKNLQRYHRFNFRKDKLVKQGYDSKKTEVEIMYERGYYRVYDSGSKLWILKF